MRFRNERGAGVVGSFFGAIAFLAFLALATHTLVSLYATSVITAVAWDNARTVANHADDGAVVAAAEADLHSRLGGFDDLTVEWKSNPTGEIGLTVGVKRPMLLPRGMTAASGFDRIQRTVWVREERLR